MISAEPSDLPGALVVTRRDRARSLARALWLRVRFGGRVAIDRRAVVGPGTRIEVAPGGRLVVGPWAWIGRGARLRVRGGALRIGAASALGPGCAAVAHRSIVIGSGCRIGDGAMLIDAEPRTGDIERPVREQGVAVAAVRVEDGARIGAHACLHAGVTVGAGASVAPRAVVRRDVRAGGASLGAMPTPARPVAPPARPRQPARRSVRRRRRARAGARAGVGAETRPITRKGWWRRARSGILRPE